ncbi:MAG: cobalamin biosynthesis protein [bacterium]
MKSINKIFFLLAVLILFSPVGILLPKIFNAGSAWGEWEIKEINNLIGYIPAGITRLSEIWHPPFPDYNFANNINNNLFNESFAYIFSGYIGALTCILLTFLWLKIAELSFKN